MITFLIVIAHIVGWSALMIKIGFEFGKQYGYADDAESMKVLKGCRWLVSQKTKQLNACVQQVKITTENKGGKNE